MLLLLLVLLLLAYLWLALDPLSGPRQILSHQTTVGLPLLTFDYVNGLGAGFLAGYFAYIAQIGPRRFGKRNLSWQFQSWLGHATAPALTAAGVVISAALLWRNAPVIWHAKVFPLASFGEQTAHALPGEGSGGGVLSDDPARLLALRCALAGRAADRGRWLAVNTAALPLPDYRRQLDHLRPAGWLAADPQKRAGPKSVNCLAATPRAHQPDLLFASELRRPFRNVRTATSRGDLRDEAPRRGSRHARETRRFSHGVGRANLERGMAGERCSRG